MMQPRTHAFEFWRFQIAGYSVAQAAAALGVTRKTIRRYEHTGIVPAPAMRLMIALAVGAPLPPGWTGWRFTDHALVSPDGAAFSPGEISALPFQYQLIAELRRELRPPFQRPLL